jgi:hypothetical protein
VRSSLAAYCLFVLLFAGAASAQLVLPDAVILDQGSARYSEQNLITTAGMDLGGNGLTADDRYANSASDTNSWVTNDTFWDYFGEGGSIPVLTFTFDSPVDIDGVAIWNYPSTWRPGNGAKDGTLEFDTGGGFGSAVSITLSIGAEGGSYLPATQLALPPMTGVVAVRLTITSNHVDTASGGDRVGLGTVAFDVAQPPPSLAPDATDMSFAPVLLEPAPQNPVLTAADVTDAPAAFVADPFLFADGANWYMFFEVMNDASGRGEIGLASSSDGGFNWSYEEIVLDESFHLSYPQVFEVDGVHYMIPETYQANSIRLYRANDFPYGWTFETTLLEGRDFVDSSIFHADGRWWIFSSDTSNANCHLYYSTSLFSGWVEHPQSPIVQNDASTGRPGGRSFVFDDGRVIRTVQNDTPHYGEAVRLFEVTELTPTQYSEVELAESPVLSSTGTGWTRSGFHHFDPWANGDHWLTVVDAQEPLGDWKIGIYVGANPEAPQASIDIDAPTGKVYVRPGESVTFSGSATDPLGEAISAYLWTFGDGSGVPDSTSASPGSIQFDAEGVFEVQLIAWNASGIADPLPATVEVIVSAPLSFAPIASVSASNDNTDTGLGLALDNLIEGPEAGFSPDAPYFALSGAAWSTITSGGDTDYFAVHPDDIVVDFRLDDVYTLTGIALWANSYAAGNSPREFALQLSTTGDADGLGPPQHFISTDVDPATMEHVAFPPADANFVRLAFSDNQWGYFSPGGDRLGMLEVAFVQAGAVGTAAAVPALPGAGVALLLAALAGSGAAALRRRPSNS